MVHRGALEPGVTLVGEAVLQVRSPCAMCETFSPSAEPLSIAAELGPYANVRGWGYLCYHGYWPMEAKPRVLVIDDEPSVRKTLTLVLQSAGYEVAVASDGEAGVELARRSPLGLVITDAARWHRWPGRDAGSDAKVPSTPIIVMTGHASVENAVAAMQAGAVDYPIKPVSPSQVRHAVERPWPARRC